MTGDSHGVQNGWFMYPINYDPIWRRSECQNFESLNPQETIAGHKAWERNILNAAARILREYFGDKTGFLLLTIPFGGPGNRARHISNMTEESVHGLIKEAADRIKKPEDVQKDHELPAGALPPIYLSTSVEHPGKKTVWLNFEANKGQAAINLNNIALEKPGILGEKMVEAIRLYFEQEQKGEVAKG